MLEIKNITKKYKGESALQNVSMSINKGMNFIIGSSGSGKTTLLKIISGIETEYTGDVTYCGKSIKTLSAKEKSYFYNNIYGFVWQDFHLIEDLTVLENVLLPTYLKQPTNQKYAHTILKELDVYEFVNQKVRYLSGGQKQRVAIARELMKNPNVILADEPTSALDEESAQITMNILRTLAKSKTVIIVTHDASLIDKNDIIFELDKGELISTETTKKMKSSKLKMDTYPKLPFRYAFSIAKTTLQHRFMRSTISLVTLMIASILLLSTCSGMIQANSQDEFNKLIQTYGDSLLDLSVIDSFMDASGTEGNDEKKPNGDVSQNIAGLYETYANDPRVEYLLHIQAYDNISIKLDGKQYKVATSGSSPVANALLSGHFPTGEGDEVLVPEAFVKKVGLDNESILGKEMDFSSSIYNWESGEPISHNVHTTAKIVGVIDTNTMYVVEGKTESFSVDDSFFFSKSTLANMRKQAGIKKEEMNFVLRTKTPSDLIHIKDEMNAKGIVPLGQFELVEDMVRLQEQSSTQSSFASVLISGLSILMVMAIFLFTNSLRKQEYAIYKANGYDNKTLSLISFCETIWYGMATILCTLILSPLLHTFTTYILHTAILNRTSICILILIIIGNAILSFLMSYFVLRKTNIIKNLNSGSKS